jgi:hypothetical protein
MRRRRVDHQHFSASPVGIQIFDYEGMADMLGVFPEKERAQFFIWQGGPAAPPRKGRRNAYGSERLRHPWESRKVSKEWLEAEAHRTSISGDFIKRPSKFTHRLTPAEEAIEMLESLIEELSDARMRTAGALVSLDAALTKARAIRALHPNNEDVQEAVAAFLEDALTLAA